MKNKKLKLNDLKVTSFVTELTGKEKITVNGGGLSDLGSPCGTNKTACSCDKGLCNGTVAWTVCFSNPNYCVPETWPEDRC